jgi:hypothetical protein
MCACVLAFELLPVGKPVAWMYTHTELLLLLLLFILRLVKEREIYITASIFNF